jgi:tetratricopeptide (TPR) repeat protein
MAASERAGLRDRKDDLAASLGTALAMSGRRHQALDAFDTVLEKEPDNAPALYQRASVLVKLLRFEEALGALESSLSLESAVADVWLLKGRVLFELGRFEGALEALDRTTALAPDNTTAWYRKGRTYIELKNPEGAIACFDQVLAHDAAYRAWLRKDDTALAQQV